MFTSLASKGISTVVASGHADFRRSSTIVDVLLFLPGVTGSLLTFLIFGTTKSWQNYRDLLLRSTGRPKVRDFRDKYNNMRHQATLKLRRKNVEDMQPTLGVVSSELDDLRPGLDLKINRDNQSSDSDLSSKCLPIMRTESSTMRFPPDTGVSHLPSRGTTTTHMLRESSSNPAIRPAYFPPLSRYSSWHDTHQ